MRNYTGCYIQAPSPLKCEATGKILGDICLSCELELQEIGIKVKDQVKLVAQFLDDQNYGTRKCRSGAFCVSWQRTNGPYFACPG